MTWLTGIWAAFRASKGAQACAAILLIVVAGLALYIWAISQHRQTVETAVQQGREQQRSDDARATLNSVKEANNAVEEMRRNPAVRDDLCLRYARNPADC